jgi:hypothetical protein
VLVALVASVVLGGTISEYAEEVPTALLAAVEDARLDESTAGVRTIEVLAVLSDEEVVVGASAETAAAELAE